MCFLHGVKVFESKVFRAIFVPKTEEEIGGCTEKIYYWFSDIMKLIVCGWVTCAENVA